MSVELDVLLADLAAAFADLPHPRVEVCGYCYSEADETALKGELTEIPDQLVVTVAAEVFDHWPEPADLYRWLTPRIITLMVTDRLHVHETLIANRLDDAGFHTWPSEQRQAVLKVAEWWWLHSLSREPDIRNHSFITDVLGFLVRTSGEVEPWLDAWTSLPPGPADAHLQLLCQFWLPDLHAGPLEVGWIGGFDIAEPLKAWVLQTGESRLRRRGHDAAEQLLSLQALRQRQ